MFIDKVQVFIKAGDGGNGAMSFRHEKFIDRGGPDGGNGGRGGNVILKASHDQNTLSALRFKKVLNAPSGQNGTGNKRQGRSGEDLIIMVPVGTVAIGAEEETLADLNSDQAEVVIAKGGAGGYGNAHFVSSTRQAPRIAEKGEKGEELHLILELKMIADVGLIGLPNAGKSTLLSVISAAKPKIANYPFTTLRPNLGVVEIDSATSLLFADIPGLIEGASAGKGLGDEFLRHVERSKLLIHLIDAYSADPVHDYKVIMAELSAYQPELAKRPQIVVLTKIEGLDPKTVESKFKKLKLAAKDTKVLAISSLNRQGLKELLFLVKKIVVDINKKEARIKNNQPVVITHRPESDAWSVKRDGNNYRVRGRKIERFVSRVELSDEHGRQRIIDIMNKMGIMRELRRQKIETGSTIIFGKNPKDKIMY